MSDRGILLLFSLGVILAALGVAAWLISTGQTAYIDGLFLLLCCLVLVLAFGLYTRYLIRSVMQAAAPPATLAKTAAKAQEKPGPPVRVPAMQSTETSR
jgi:putative copper export protein